MATKAHLEGNKRHQAKLDRGIFYVPKGGMEKIRLHAEARGFPSVNAYINQLIQQDMPDEQEGERQ